MRIVLVTSGSRGDVQPYVMLGLELQRRGHEVVLAAEKRMQSLVEQLAPNICYKIIAGDPTGMLFEKKYQALLAKGSIMKVMKATEDHNKAFYTQVLQDIAAACAGASLILSAPLTLTATMCVAQKLGVPWVPVCLGPVLPTAEFPSWAISNSPFSWKWLNKASYSLIFWALWKQEAARINKWRAESLDLPPLKHGVGAVLEAAEDAIPVVMMCSKHVIPGLTPPADWSSSAHLTGFAFPEKTPEDGVDPKLRSFIDKCGEERPLYLGFGSMPAPDPTALLQLAVKVVQQTQRRAVLVAGWSDLASIIGQDEGQVQLPDELFVAPHAPHDWLLPRCCAAVHHCGVGTCGAVLRAGIPSVPCPVMLDQPFLAARLVEAGVACKPLPFYKVTEQGLIDRIQQVLKDSTMQARAAAVAQDVASYGGVAAAADVVLQATSPWEQLQGQM